MRLIRPVVPVLIAVFFLLAIPTDADAQIDWIRRMSGPAYTPAFFIRPSICIGKNKEKKIRITCATLSIAPIAPAVKERETVDADARKWEFQVAVAVTRGTGGDNREAGISDSRIWVVEPQLRFLWLNWSNTGRAQL